MGLPPWHHVSLGTRPTVGGVDPPIPSGCITGLALWGARHSHPLTPQPKMTGGSLGLDQCRQDAPRGGLGASLPGDSLPQTLLTVLTRADSWLPAPTSNLPERTRCGPNVLGLTLGGMWHG